MAARIVGDIIFGEPARYLAGLHSAHGQPTYPLSLRRALALRAGRYKGTAHAQERQYVFDTLHTSPYPTDDNDKVQAQFAVKYWTNFAKTGDPNGASLPHGRAMRRRAIELLEFTNAGPVAKTSPHKERWDAITARYQ